MSVCPVADKGAPECLFFFSRCHKIVWEFRSSRADALVAAFPLWRGFHSPSLLEKGKKNSLSLPLILRERTARAVCHSQCRLVSNLASSVAANIVGPEQ